MVSTKNAILVLYFPSCLGGRHEWQGGSLNPNGKTAHKIRKVGWQSGGSQANNWFVAPLAANKLGTVALSMLSACSDQTIHLLFLGTFTLKKIVLQCPHPLLHSETWVILHRDLVSLYTSKENSCVIVNAEEL